MRRSQRTRPLPAGAVGGVALLASLGVAWALPLARADAAAAEVVSYPGPGWRFVSPTTSITLQGAGVSALGRVHVTGSASGPRSARLAPLRLARGAVLTMRTPFRPGERVTVRVPLPVRGAPDGVFSFRIARRGRPPATAEKATPAQTGPPRPAHQVATCRLRRHRFRTLPRLRPVRICLTRPPDGRVAHGAILVTPKMRPRQQQALLMLDNAGELLWDAPRRDYVRDLKVVSYRGRRRLAFFQHAPGKRSYYGLLDHRYRLVRRIRPGNGYRLNMHDLQLTGRGSAYLSAYQPVLDPRTRVSVIDYVLQEVDVRTGQVLFEWHSLDHVPPSASFKRRPSAGAWDYFHGNSIDPPRPSDPTIVVSARNTSAIYGIDRRTGAVRWTLGGRQDQLGVREHPEWQFCAQHDARRLPNGHLSVFDNGGHGRDLDTTACPLHPARVEEFRLGSGSAQLVRAISSTAYSESGAGYFPRGLGNAQLQRNGDTLIDWGSARRITEITPDGDVALGLRLGRQSYRAVRARWVGRPRGRPRALARRRGRDAVTVWASWNGATRIRRWQVLAGRSRRTLAPAGPPARFTGLETTMRITTTRRLVMVRALDARGRIIGRSRAVIVR